MSRGRDEREVIEMASRGRDEREVIGMESQGSGVRGR